MKSKEVVNAIKRRIEIVMQKNLAYVHCLCGNITQAELAFMVWSVDKEDAVLENFLRLERFATLN